MPVLGLHLLRFEGDAAKDVATEDSGAEDSTDKDSAAGEWAAEDIAAEGCESITGPGTMVALTPGLPERVSIRYRDEYSVVVGLVRDPAAVLEEEEVGNMEGTLEVELFHVPVPVVIAPPSRRGSKIAAACESIERQNE